MINDFKAVFVDFLQKENDLRTKALFARTTRLWEVFCVLFSNLVLSAKNSVNILFLLTFKVKHFILKNR